MSETLYEEQPSPSDEAVKFLVGPEKVEFSIEKDKLTKFLQYPFNGEKCSVDIPVNSFRVFVNMVDDEAVEIGSACTAFDLLNLAKGMFCIRLSSICVDYLRGNYECDRALAIYEYAKTNKLTDLAKSCLGYIAPNIDLFIETEDFYKLSPQMIAELYSIDDLNVTELQLFSALVSYAKRHSCDMKVALDKIRFQDMDMKRLMRLDNTDYLLTDKELLQIVIENSECRKTIVQRDGYQSIQIDYDTEPSSRDSVETFRFRCELAFSRDVFVKSVNMNRELDISTKRTKLFINDVETVADIVGCRISIHQTIRRGEAIRMILNTGMATAGSIVVGNASTEAPDVRVNPGHDGYKDISLIDRLIIKRIDKKKNLDITVLSEEMS